MREATMGAPFKGPHQVQDLPGQVQVDQDNLHASPGETHAARRWA
jgi:hypothetical protein